MEKRIAKQIAKLKPHSSKRNSVNDEMDSESESEDTDLLEGTFADDEEDKYHNITASKVRKILKTNKLQISGEMKIAQIVNTIKKHEYNYCGDDKNKVRKIGIQLYSLKKKYQVAVGTTKGSLCADTEDWLKTAVLILKKKKKKKSLKMVDYETSK